MGKRAPDPGFDFVTPDGCVIHKGNGCTTDIKNSTSVHNMWVYKKINKNSNNWLSLILIFFN